MNVDMPIVPPVQRVGTEWECWVCLAAMVSTDDPPAEVEDRVCPSCRRLRALAGIETGDTVIELCDGAPVVYTAA